MSPIENMRKNEPDLHEGQADSRHKRVRNSSLWAAYADALGFISELADEDLLNHRTNGALLDKLLSWPRKVGGRAGVEVELPAGCWSDDTQLRMAVSRAITHRGFDVESFARVELPVWPSYSLGGGRASKAAAANLAKSDTLWFANTYKHWTQAGGNGAAMRVQPHVWAAEDTDEGFLLDVIADSVCTHGHPRSIAGASFHAQTLAYCLQNGDIPDIDQCIELAVSLHDALYRIADHPSLGGTWLGLWEQHAGRAFEPEWKKTIEELVIALETVPDDQIVVESETDRYLGVIRRLGLTRNDQKGSGVLTAVAAVALAGIAKTPLDGAIVAANALGTDTDTIGTMTGALLGAAFASEPPPQDPMDASYLLAEADRLSDIALGKETSSHSYPDVLMWNAPQTQSDALVELGGELHVRGLGPVKVVDVPEPITWTTSGDFGWQWVRTSFGQTLLIKRRPEMPSLDESLDLTHSSVSPMDRKARSQEEKQTRAVRRRNGAALDHGIDIDRAIQYARDHIDDDSELGFTVRRVARQGTMAELVALVANLREHLRRE